MQSRKAYKIGLHNVTQRKNKMKIENEKYIPISEIPFAYRNDYERIFSKIPVGMALVINGESQIRNVKAVLRRAQMRGEFLNLRVMKRGNMGYVGNKGEE